MSELEQLGRVTEANVLIIGGGFAGCWAAIRAKDLTDRVVLVDKAKVARSGCSTFVAGVQLCPTPDDDLDIWKRELVEAGDYFPDQDWLDIFFQNQIERIRDYEKWGAPIERDERGKILRFVGRGHINTKMFQFRGPRLIELVKEQALQKGVTIVERVMITDLLTSDGTHPTRGKVVGAVGFDTRTGEFHIFRAKAIVMAAGPISRKQGYVTDNCTGDGVAAAFRAGAELTNMEFCTRGNIEAWERKGIMHGINMIQGYGAYFVNAQGERFMGKYDPTRWERSQLAQLCMGFAKEALEGRGPIYVDMTHFPTETWERFRRVIPTTMRFWDGLVDVRKQKVECTPIWDVMSWAGEGGIKTDTRCRTNIPSLYAAGAVTRYLAEGIYNVGGVATASCNVAGYLAGENAAKTAVEAGKVDIEPGQAQQLKQLAFLPLQVKEGMEPLDLLDRISEATVPARFSMFKNATRIIRVLSQLERVKEDLPRLAASNIHELVKANEVENYALCCEVVFRAALERKESRQFHYREEYPYRDDAEWLKLIVFKKEGDRLTVRHESIPVGRWPIKPERFVKVSHPVQMFITE